MFELMEKECIDTNFNFIESNWECFELNAVFKFDQNYTLLKIKCYCSIVVQSMYVIFTSPTHFSFTFNDIKLINLIDPVELNPIVMIQVYSDLILQIHDNCFISFPN